jgi:hypothetical protein
MRGDEMEEMERFFEPTAEESILRQTLRTYRNHLKMTEELSEWAKDHIREQIRETEQALARFQLKQLHVNAIREGE